MIKSYQDNITIISLEGKLVRENSGTLEELLMNSINPQEPHICVDMTDLEYLCSSALGALIDTKKEIALHGGDIKLIVVNEAIYNLFRITDLDTFFEIYKTREDCINSFK